MIMACKAREQVLCSEAIVVWVVLLVHPPSSKVTKMSLIELSAIEDDLAKKNKKKFTFLQRLISTR